MDRKWISGSKKSKPSRRPDPAPRVEAVKKLLGVESCIVYLDAIPYKYPYLGGGTHFTVAIDYQSERAWAVRRNSPGETIVDELPFREACGEVEGMEPDDAED